MDSDPSNIERVRQYLANVDSHPDLPDAVQDHSNSPNPFDDQFNDFISGVEGDGVDTTDGINNMGLDKELIDQINEKKKNGMFVSAWQDDEDGIEEKEMNDGEFFLTAAEEGDLNKVQEMLSKNAQLLMWRDSDKYTALHRAAYNNHMHVLEYLLERGADAEAKTAEGWTALHSASNWANYEVVGRLLSHGVDVNCRSHGNLTALHVALCSEENADSMFHTVRYLVQAPGIDLSAVSGAGDTPLDLARRYSKSCYELIQDKLNRL